MALWGIESCVAVSGAWTSVRPPRSLIARSPTVPSWPAPESTTPTARSPWSAARELKNASMTPGAAGSAMGVTRNAPLVSVSRVPGAMT